MKTPGSLVNRLTLWPVFVQSLFSSEGVPGYRYEWCTVMNGTVVELDFVMS